MRVELAGFGSFLVLCAIVLWAYALQDYAITDKPAEFEGSGFYPHAAYFLAILAAAWAATRILQRPALWLTLSALAIVAGLPWTILDGQILVWFSEADELQLHAWRVLLAFAGMIVLLRVISYVAPESGWPRRLGALILFCLILAWPWYWHQDGWLFYPPEDDTSSDIVDDDTAPEPPAPNFDAEQLMMSQSQQVDRAVDTLSMDTQGKVDLYALGFAGDGSENVFRNEVDYFQQLMARRFDADGRTLSLINNPDTIDSAPLATLSNLRRALQGVAGRMDRKEDVLLLFLTSHGSREHELYVDLDPLPLDQIRPEDLRSALDDAGIRWRVVVVSACYSGGFVDALRDPYTLVITAARSDRSSFGCGADSDITWFGKAFLTEALNRTTDFEQAFALTSKRIREWELAQGDTPSVPQMAAGEAIGQKLAVWRSQMKPGPVVPFQPKIAASPVTTAAR